MVCSAPTVTCPTSTPRTACISVCAASSSASTRRARATSSVAGLGHLHPARRPVDQAQPELVLEPADLLRQRRLGDVLTRRRAREVTFLGQRDEVAELAQFHKQSL